MSVLFVVSIPIEPLRFTARTRGQYKISRGIGACTRISPTCLPPICYDTIDTACIYKLSAHSRLAVQQKFSYD